MGTLLDSNGLTVEVRLFELMGEIISDEAAATIAGDWYSIAAPQLTMLATHVNPFADARFSLASLETEARFEQRLMLTDITLSDREKARYTRDFEALYAWIEDRKA